jgi:ribonucleotide reductase alpha subunit
MKKEYYWLNKDSRKFLEKDYLFSGETPEERIEHIAHVAEIKLGIDGFAVKFVDYMKQGFYSLSTPVWANFGRERGLPISCFGSYIPDDIYDILFKFGEIGAMSAGGGGTSAYFGDVRGRGTPIKSGGAATGVHHQLTVYESLTNYVSQGNVRRGSFAAYLPVDHTDIEEFLKIRSEGDSIQELSFGVCVSDEWMKSMIEGDKHKRKIWGSIIKKRFESGYPYIFFTDNVNNQAPQVYKDKGLKIRASNLCVTGDTVIDLLIDDKYPLLISIKDLGCYMEKHDNIKVKSYDIELKKEVYSTVEAFAQTGESIDIIEIKDEQGNTLKCTPEHKIYTSNRGYVEARDLREDDELVLVKKIDHKSGIKNIIKIKKYKQAEPVYDITVKKTKNFYANKILVHNCSEIFLSTNRDESFVCDLSSINLERWDELIKTDAIETLIFFLDAVMSEFIEKTENIALMQAARRFAINQRALGLGVLGWHSYLQSKMIAFESMDAKLENSKIWQEIRKRTDAASEQLAALFGEPPLLVGYGRRNTTTIAIAPTTSSSFILGQVSPSIEPLNSNYFVKDLAKGKFTYRNPYLEQLLKEKNKNDVDTWKSILTRGGSVQHLEFLSQEEKDVFKTFSEISQKEIIIQAAQRQKYIDQGQSLNLMIPPTTKAKEVNELMIFAWEQGIKSLYYQRSANPAQELARSIMNCTSCEG